MIDTTVRPRLQADDLSVHFGDRSALESISPEFRASEIVSLVGPNGAGKSTLLRALAGLLPPSHGYIRLDGKTVTGPESCIVYVPQRTAVDWSFPVSVLDVVLMARRQQRSRLLPYGQSDRAAAMEALRQVEMDEFSSVQISQLSGGQQQRVFLARALLEDGDVYLLDEPFTGVDIPTQDLLIALFRDLCQQGKTVIFATHDLEQALESSDRLIMLNRKIIADGKPSETLTIDNLRLAYGSTTPRMISHQS